MNVSSRQRTARQIWFFCCCAAGKRFCKDPLQKMASSALPMFGLILLLLPVRKISRGPSSKNGFLPSSDSASSCALGKRFCMDPLQQMVSSGPCASLTRSTLEKGRDSNSLLGSEGFRIGFAKDIVGVAKVRGRICSFPQVNKNEKI